MAAITVHKVTSSGAMPLRLQVGAIAYHYASGAGVAVRLVGGEALQLSETPDEFEILLDPAFKPAKPAKAKGGKAPAEPAPATDAPPVLPLEGDA